jgi:type VI secretion system secreted protein Hcp
MAFDAFLKLDDIPGESTDDKHRDEIDVLSYSWLVGAAPSATSSAQLTALVVNKNIDTASPRLFDAACSGRVIRSGRLTLRSAGFNQIEFMRIDLENIKVIRLSPQWADGGSAIESVQLQFGSATMTFREQNPDGSAGSTFSATCSV